MGEYIEKINNGGLSNNGLMDIRRYIPTEGDNERSPDFTFAFKDPSH
jgi:hypothetical protein